MQKRLEDYYKGAFYGNSVACLLYHMSKSLNKENNDLLWLAIIGLSDLYISQKIPASQYQ